MWNIVEKDPEHQRQVGSHNQGGVEDLPKDIMMNVCVKFSSHHVTVFEAEGSYLEKMCYLPLIK